MPDSPRGIFVGIDFNLYMVDTSNNRIQLFRLGQINAKTVAGKGAPGTIILNYPTGIVLDADGYLFIVDCYNHCIIRSGPTGFYYIIDCSSAGGSGPNQLLHPAVMSFDSYGNIFVADNANSRVQKFILSTNSCSKYRFVRLPNT